MPSRSSAAEYLEQSARPAHRPVASHQRQDAGPSTGSAAIRQVKVPSKAAKSGPSGKTQLPAVIPRTGAAFNTTAAHKPASRPKSPDVTRYISQVVSAKSRIKGNRTTT